MTPEDWPGSPFPDWLTEFRPAQIDAANQIVDLFNSGVDVVILDAPVGAGKTAIAEMVRRKLGEPKSSYVCSGLDLQTQFATDFTYAKVLKGRSNYPTMNRPDYTAADCGGQKCGWCEPRNECPYGVAKVEAIKGDVAVLNTSYLLTFQSPLFVRPFVVIDECDTLEATMLRHWEFYVGERRLAELAIQAPVKAARQKTIVAWLEEELIPGAKAELAQLLLDAERMGPELAAQDVERRRQWDRATSNVEKGELVVGQLAAGLPWVRDYVWSGGRQSGDFLMKPVEVSKQGAAMLWDRGAARERWDRDERKVLPVAATKWLCMSGTVIDPGEWAESCGVDSAGLRWDLVTVPMLWDKANRPIVTRTVADMARKSMDKEFPVLMERLVEICREHAGENILVHCVNYNLMRNIVAWLRREHIECISYENARDRAMALKRFKDHGGVIVAPSLDRGVDLPGDLCRVMVIAKMPYLNLGDRQVSERLNTRGGNLWMAVATARTLVQATGRGVRHADDKCVTYVLDSQFDGWFRRWKRLLPKWWRLSIVGQLPANWKQDERQLNG